MVDEHRSETGVYQISDMEGYLGVSLDLSNAVGIESTTSIWPPEDRAAAASAEGQKGAPRRGRFAEINNISLCRPKN